MLNIRGPYRIGGIFLFLSAILLAVGAAMGGGMVSLLVLALISIALALGILRDMRWLAYLAFLFALVVLIVSTGSSAAPTTVLPNALWMLIAGANLIAAIGLFAALWNRPERAS